MFDYAALRAIAAIVETGSFERAAARLNVTPSAISQRVKQLEERLGAVLIVRGTPCMATEKGEWLCRHMEQVGMLEEELMAHLPGLSPQERRLPVTVQVATSADSLGSWFLPAIAAFTEHSPYLVSVVVDDEDHTADWLRQGRVSAAVTSLAQPVSGCRLSGLGTLRYRAVASPAFMARFFPQGVTAEALCHAPAVTFNQKDDLQDRWIRQVTGGPLVHPTHWLPSTQAFLEASLSGIGWCLNPALLCDTHLQAGRLVELVPEQAVDVPLYWQISRIAAERLSGLTRAVMDVARERLLPLLS